MTKRQAKALLAAQRRINGALDSVLKTLDSRDREYAEAYWAGSIRSTINGRGYGSAPVGRAAELLETTVA